MTHPTAAWIAPFLCYLVGVTLAAQVPTAYPLAYTVVAAVTAAVLCWSLPKIAELRPHRGVGPGIVVGLIGIAAWIALSHWQLEQRLAAFLPSWLTPGERVGFNPFDKVGSPALAWAFVGVRLLGLAVLVPLAEEIFWRGFLLRWLISDRWQEVPLGQYQTKSFLIVTALFAAAHPEWIAAAVYGALINGLMVWKKNLWVCVVAHAVSNLVLGIYVLVSGAWWLW